jgi:DNA invertase Pin-like site-specific DNA recombinase
MSSDQQNPRSPEQQGDTIHATLKRCGYPWVHVGDYTDAAISGRYVTKRPDFQRMLRAVRTGTLGIDLILVDTFERFGRADELGDLRRELDHKYGVLVLTADTQFTDPTTVAGKALSAIESIRSTDDTRIKAHTVLRGKRDAARLGHWPGGVAPFGYKLQSVLVERNGRQEVDHCLLVPDPESAWIIQKLFATALSMGWGSSRLTHMINHDPDVPAKFKPFYDQSVNYWMQNPIYYGELLWEKHCTGIVDEARVIQRNADEDMLRVPNFCEALVTREVWNAVQALRSVRSERVRQARLARRQHTGKQIAAVSAGLALTYLLSGLVRCGHCDRSMVAASTTQFTMKSGLVKRYVRYTCPGYLAGACPNLTRVPEPWLRATIVGLLRQRLFRSFDSRDSPGLRSCSPLQWESQPLMANLAQRPAEQLSTDCLAQLVRQVQQELDRQPTDQVDRRPALEREYRECQARVRGWSQSLAKPDLSDAVRAVVEADLGASVEQQRQLERQLAAHDAQRQRARVLVDTDMVIDRLTRLDEVLAANDPTRGNLELSLHIEMIRCFHGGRVVVRTSKLGALAGTGEQVAAPVPATANSTAEAGDVIKATPRRRARLRVENRDEHGNDLRAAALTAADVNRFAALGQDWFWEDCFQVPSRTCWAEAHASAVTAKKAETGWSLEKLAEFFRKSIPTIRKALNFGMAQPAADSGPENLAR